VNIATSEIRVGAWTIFYENFIGPMYVGVHDDFDGAPMHSESNDCPDRRCFTGQTVEEVLDQITTYEVEENGATECGVCHKPMADDRKTFGDRCEFCGHLEMALWSE